MASNGRMDITPSGSIMRGRFPDGDFPGDAVTRCDVYVSGHSLFTHNDGTGSNAPATDWTRTGTWMGLFADHVSNDFSGGGNFGQIAQLNTDYDSNWIGSPGLPTSEDIQYRYSSNTISFYPPSSGNFAAQNFTHFFFMASNFEEIDDTPNDWLARTLTLLDRLNAGEPSAVFYFYIHWPLPNNAGGGSFVDNTNLTASEWTTYRAYERGAFLTWHLSLLDLVRQARPGYNIRGIPVGPIVSDIVENESYFSTVVFTDLFGDSAPHGTESMYWLAGLITYIAVYKRAPDLTGFTNPAGATQVISEITSNYAALSTYCYNRLVHYHDNTLQVF